MSYSMTFGPLAKPLQSDEIEEAMLAKAAEIPETDGTPSEEIRHHVMAAARAAVDIASTLGTDEDSVTISLTGHAEPGHGQRASWSPETMSLHVSVQRRI